MGGRYPDCPLSSLPIIMCKGRLYTHAFFRTALVCCFVVLFCFPLIFQFLIRGCKTYISNYKKKKREKERAKGPGDVISKEVRT